MAENESHEHFMMDERTDDLAPIIIQDKDDEMEQPTPDEDTMECKDTVAAENIDPLMEEWEIKQVYEKIGENYICFLYTI